jgi:membrane protein
LIRTGWQAYRLWDRFDCIDLSAAFAYHTLQSIFPLLLIALAVASRILGTEDGLADQLVLWSQQIFPPSATQLIEATLLKLYNQRAGAGAFGLLFLLITASNTYLTLQRGSDRLWGWRSSEIELSKQIQPQSPLHAVRRFLFQRLKAFALVVVAGVLLGTEQLLANLRLIGHHFWGDGLIRQLPRVFRAMVSASSLTEFLVSWLIASTVALALLRLLPSGRLPVRPLIPGAVLIGGLHTLLTVAISRSLVSLGSRFQAYGVVSGVLVLTLWVWLLGLIFYYGTAVSVVLTRRWQGGDPHLPKADRECSARSG